MNHLSVLNENILAIWTLSTDTIHQMTFWVMRLTWDFQCFYKQVCLTDNFKAAVLAWDCSSGWRNPGLSFRLLFKRRAFATQYSDNVCITTKCWLASCGWCLRMCFLPGCFLSLYYYRRMRTSTNSPSCTQCTTFVEHFHLAKPWGNPDIVQNESSDTALGANRSSWVDRHLLVLQHIINGTCPGGVPPRSYNGSTREPCAYENWVRFPVEDLLLTCAFMTPNLASDTKSATAWGLQCLILVSCAIPASGLVCVMYYLILLNSLLPVKPDEHISHVRISRSLCTNRSD